MPPTDPSPTGAPGTPDRHLAWEGCVNVRDLGGLPTTGGGRTRPGAVVRADSPHRLTAAGWAALWEHGVRTVVDLRHPHERDADPDRAPRPEGLATVHAPLEDADDQAFLDEWLLHLFTPHYYEAAFARYAGRVAQVVEAVAEARPGGVLMHCVLGRDRTGQASLLLLALAGVAPETIAEDHGLSANRTAPIDVHHDLIGPSTPERRAEHRRAVLDLLGRLDPAAYLREAGVHPVTIARARSRLVTPP